MTSIERNRKTSLLIAFVSFIVINYFRWNDLDPWDTMESYRSSWLSYVTIALRPLTAWCWVLAIIGYGRKYLNRKHRALQYINEAVYPFYIIHQTVIVILSFYVVKTTDTVFLKYSFTVGVTFLITVFSIHLLVKPFKLMRFLFGMSPVKARAAVSKATDTTSHVPPVLEAAN